MKKLYNAIGVFTLSKNGSLVFCENCEKILASINKDGYQYINITLSCTCGTHGNIEIGKTAKLPDIHQRVGGMPAERNGVAVCKKCRTPIFSVISDRVRGYSFYAQCTCGEKYDIVPTFSKRLGETIKNFKNR